MSEEREDPAASYAQILAGLSAVGPSEWTLAQYAHRIAYYLQIEQAKCNPDTGLVKLLHEAACVGYECIQLMSAPPPRPEGGTAESESGGR